jgi:hypothetical protein
MEEEVKEGVVIFLKSNEGSKSECSLPYLYLGKNIPLQALFMENDNPFENNGFLDYDGCRIRVFGKTSSDNFFVVNKIEAI